MVSEGMTIDCSPKRDLADKEHLNRVDGGYPARHLPNILICLASCLLPTMYYPFSPE